MENNGLDKIIARITWEAQLEADKVIEEAEAEKTKILAEYKIKADEITAKYREKAEMTRSLGEQKATSSLETAKRNAALEAKNALLDSVFENARKKILSLDEKSYFEFLKKLLGSVIDDRISQEKQSAETGDEICFANEFTVKMNKTDGEKYAKKLCDFAKKAYPETRIVFDKSPCDIDGGLIVICSQLEVNCSVSLLLKSKRDLIEKEVADMLFGGR